MLLTNKEIHDLEADVWRLGCMDDTERKSNMEFARAVEAAVLAKMARGEPNFIKHEVETPSDWSDWVCPNPSSYFMKCCDCGLVHEAQFKVVKYNNDEDHQDCEDVEDQNLQAVFRMRRSEQWESTDMAHRVGGMSIDDATAPAQAQGDQNYWLKAYKLSEDLRRHLSVRPAPVQDDTTLLRQCLDALIWTTGSGDFGEGGTARTGAEKLLFPAINALKARLGETK